MSRTLTLTRRTVVSEPTMPQATPNTRLVETRGYGDDMIVRRYGLHTLWTGDNFNHLDYWASTGIKSSGVHSSDWAAVTKFQRLERADFEYLASIQPDDYHIWEYTLGQKLNWLIGQADGSPPARPYWTIGGKWSENWEELRFGTMVFGNSRVRVKTNADGSLKVTRFVCEYKEHDPNSSNGASIWKEGEIEFVEVDGFKPIMKEWPLEWLVENGYIQQATEAMSRPAHNTIGYSPRGNMLHPVWDVKSWPSNYGSALYLARFCIKE